jgi:CheY-like chemotaxis protein
MDKNKVFKDFVDVNEVLIVDKNPSSRSRLVKVMSDLGCKRHMIHTAGSLIEAQEIIITKKIGIILSDYIIGGGSGFDLFKMLRKKIPTAKDTCLVLVTSNINQSSVAKAAEEDVDSFIIKPFTIQSIQESLLSTICAKVQPSEYQIKIDEGKDHLFEGRYDEAVAAFKAAKPLHAKPALALFYLGQAEYLQDQVDQAQNNYVDGLELINIHYKCLVGLYEILVRDEKYTDAYQVIKKIARFFPANPDRLNEIIHLAIKTENFADMQMYYEIFTQLDSRPNHVVNYVGAGLFISGKYNLLNNNRAQATTYFDELAVSCSEFTKYIRAVISILVEHDFADDAERYLTRFASENRDKEDYLVSEFLINAKKGKDLDLVVKSGLELYNRKVRDFDCMKFLVKALEVSGYSGDKLSQYREEMMQLWPDKMAA